MRLARTFLTVSGIAVLFGQSVSPVSCKESFTAEQVFENSKAGVVSVFTGANYGSGFLIDDAGLILTSCESIKDGTKNLRVKFGPDQVVAGKVIINDRDHDIAVIRVNLKNIHSFKSLPLGKENVESAKTDERVVFLGLSKKSSEKTMTASTVRMMEKEAILVRGKADPFGLGGPLMNLDGEVIGISTVVANMPGHPAATPISVAGKDIQDAKVDAAKLEAPSADLLPDMPATPFNVSELLKDNPDFLKNRKQNDYNFGSSYFSVSVFTPVQGYFQLGQMFEKLTGTKRDTAQGGALDESELEMSKEFYDTEKPVVTVMVIPKMRISNGGKLLNAASLLGTTSAIVATSLVGIPMIAPGVYANRRTIEKDFLDLKLVDADGKLVSEAIEARRVPYEKESIAMTGYKFPKLEDMAYIGIYTFDSRCFESDKGLKLIVGAEGKGGKEGQMTVDFPDSLKKKIVDDFKPYWTAVSKATVAKSTPEKKSDM